MKFSELNLEDSVLRALDAMNFQECTPVHRRMRGSCFWGWAFR